jgi:hypothetical protein
MEVLNVLLSVLSASEHFITPILLSFLFFTWWRVDKLEGRLSSIVDNGLLSTIVAAKLQIESIHQILQDNKDSQAQLQERIDAELKAERDKAYSLGERLAGLMERCKAIHGGDTHGH